MTDTTDRMAEVLASIPSVYADIKLELADAVICYGKAEGCVREEGCEESCLMLETFRKGAEHAAQSLAADNARLLALVGAVYPIPHAEGCELDPAFGDSVWSYRMNEEDPDGDLDQRWPSDAKCICGVDEMNAQARLALNPAEGDTK